MSFTINNIENELRQREFTERVVAAANDHMRITEPTWDLYDVRVSTESGFLGEKKVAVTLLFKEKGLGVL